MIKTTLKEIKANSNLQGRDEFKNFLKKNGLKPVKVRLIAYSESIYGLGAYLAEFTLDDDSVIYVNTGNRSQWNYGVVNGDFGL